jgi:CRP/FNR family transcriptional regulator
MTRPDWVAETRADRLVGAIRGVPMFHGLSDEDVARIASVATLRRYERAEVLWNAGDPAESLTVVVEGRVKVVRHSDGGDVILEIFGAGEPVGAIAVYNAMPYPASAVCLEPATLIVLSRRDYFDLLERHPALTRGILRELTKLFLALTRKVGEMRGQSVEGRIAQLFLSLAERMGRPVPEGIEIPLHLTRQEIAQMVGTTVESAIRVLSRWGRDGILVSGDKRFVLPSRERLEALRASLAGEAHS